MNKVFFSLLLLSAFVSCKDNEHAHYKKEILGRWAVIKSELNNKPSRSMENAYFDFNNQGKVTTNVLEEQELDYTLNGTKVVMESAQPLGLDITYMQEDSMILEGNYSLYYLKLFLKKEK